MRSAENGLARTFSSHVEPTGVSNIGRERVENLDSSKTDSEKSRAKTKSWVGFGDQLAGRGPRQARTDT